MATLGRNVAGPLLLLHLVMYFGIVGFASWIRRQRRHHVLFLIFALLAGVVGIVSKLAGGTHIWAWRSDSLVSAASSALIAWTVNALAFGLACKEINAGGWKGWRFEGARALHHNTDLHTAPVRPSASCRGMHDRTYQQGYRDVQYGPVGEPVHKHKGGGATTGAIVI